MILFSEIFLYNNINIDTNGIYSLSHLYKKYMEIRHHIELYQHPAASLFLHGVVCFLMEVYEYLKGMLHIFYRIPLNHSFFNSINKMITKQRKFNINLNFQSYIIIY